MALTEAQREARMKGLGSSDMPKLLGGKQHNLWLEKTGRSEGFEGNYLTEWGDLMEPVLLGVLSERTGKSFLPNSVVRVGKEPWMLATPDGVAIDPARPGENIIGEAKTVTAWAAPEWGEEGTDQIPEKYLAQVQWQMHVTGIKRTAVVAEIHHEIRIYWVEYDKAIGDALERIGREFWQYVTSDTPPPMDGTEGASRTLLELFPEHRKGEYVEPTSDSLQLVEEYRIARQTMGEWKAQVDLAKQRICEVIGDHHGMRGALEGASFSISWPLTKPRTITDWKAIAKELGASEHVIAKHSKVGRPSRRFTARFKGDDE